MISVPAALCGKLIHSQELDARIEIAKAESNKQGVTVNTGK